MSEIICKDDAINTAVRMVADGDEGCLPHLMQLQKHLWSLRYHIVYYAQIIEHAACKVGSSEMCMAVIQRIDLINSQYAHGTTGKRVAYRTTKEWRHLFQFLQGKERHV